MSSKVQRNIADMEGASVWEVGRERLRGGMRASGRGARASGRGARASERGARASRRGARASRTRVRALGRETQASERARAPRSGCKHLGGRTREFGRSTSIWERGRKHLGEGGGRKRLGGAIKHSSLSASVSAHLIENIAIFPHEFHQNLLYLVNFSSPLESPGESSR